ncbi:rhodanese-like domain-containing protein [Ignavibacteria bacterium CHB1]|jgi:Rhodanese-related sulfurtransferase|nr:MAG: rhodanese-like domain-containing protein [Chlorobiota bacterium]KXK02421.1 MAG: rhodanese-related sulfurtransferase [Chlorobi bacterium OLB4]MBV6398019.1 Sulfurtransferase [Ignavibacteria bacterium]MCC6886467.1 rhodanese-like domain-containing protein [Ignavibacteriales bacterium]MCE7952458.1 rhodanese-like domain-containing protein [Chlorobi bacterium CHB7]MDL1886574.1 rhodanese-like domain-containing protein [Ignavibacteria bacterium CHB1]OQY77325.1 MAG: hypothetical protein B6D43_0
MKIDNIDPHRFKALLETGEYELIDVRTKQEYDKARLDDCLLIDAYDSEFQENINKLDKEKKFLIYCRSGSRSMMTLQLMQMCGFKEAYDLKGGILSWSRQGFEVKK